MALMLSLLEYMRYLEATVNSRCVSDGEEVLNAGHIILFGKTEASECFFKICALCLQTSALQTNPHEISGILEIKNNRLTIKKMMCSCKAGNSGRCKHISAVLIKCTREDLNLIEDVSKTDLKCVWSMEKTNTKKKYSAVPIKSMRCVSKQKNEYVVDEDELLNHFVHCLPNSAIGKHRSGRRHAPEESTQMNSYVKSNVDYTKLILAHSCQSVLMMQLASTSLMFDNDCCEGMYSNLCNEDPSVAILTLQNSKEWHELRKYRVTGSRCYEIYTYSKDNWESKSMKYFWPKNFTNKFIKHGLKYEDKARQLFILASEKKVVECGMVISHSNKWLSYSPDGIIFDNNQPNALLEIKCLYSGAYATIVEALASCHYIIQENGTYHLKKKHKYYGQIQLGLALLNLDKCFLVVYASFDDSFLIVEIEFDHDFAYQMLTTVKHNFFHKMWHTLCKENVLT